MDKNKPFARREDETGEEYIKRLDKEIEFCDRKIARLERISKNLDRFILVISAVYAVFLGYLSYGILH